MPFTPHTLTLIARTTEDGKALLFLARPSYLLAREFFRDASAAPKLARDLKLKLRKAANLDSAAIKKVFKRVADEKLLEKIEEEELREKVAEEKLLEGIVQSEDAPKFEMFEIRRNDKVIASREVNQDLLGAWTIRDGGPITKAEKVADSDPQKKAKRPRTQRAAKRATELSFTAPLAKLPADFQRALDEQATIELRIHVTHPALPGHKASCSLLVKLLA